MIKLSYRKTKGITSVIITCVIVIWIMTGCGAVTEVTWELEESTKGVEEETTQEYSSEENVAQSPNKTDVMFWVYVCGAVHNPGVYGMPAGSRLYEAVELAGGMTEQADTAYLNLARQLTDGEQIVVPTIEETAGQKQDLILGEQSKGTDRQGGLVNINTASASQLAELNGIGESRAEAIIEYRNTHGRFTSIEEIKNVAGIKEGLYHKIKDHIIAG